MINFINHNPFLYIGDIMKHYTNKEKQYIEKNYLNTPTRDIAKKLNRTLKAIQKQAEICGLKKENIKGKNNPNYRGGNPLFDGRYNILFGKHDCPYSNTKGVVREHIYVWWKNFPDDPILLGECIHHKNMIKTDNRIENLQKMKISEHNKLHKIFSK